MIQFHESVMGHRFFEGTLPKLCDQLEAIAAELKRANDIKELEIQKAKEKIPPLTEELPFEVRAASPFYTGGGIYLFVGCVEQRGNKYFFSADECSESVSVIDTSPYLLTEKQHELIFDPEWLKWHELPAIISEPGWFIDQLIFYILEHEPQDEWCNYNMQDIRDMAKRRCLSV